MAITSDMLSGLQTAITSNLGVIVPVGITIFGGLLAVKLVPKIVKYFVK